MNPGDRNSGQSNKKLHKDFISKQSSILDDVHNRFTVRKLLDYCESIESKFSLYEIRAFKDQTPTEHCSDRSIYSARYYQDNQFSEQWNNYHFYHNPFRILKKFYTDLIVSVYKQYPDFLHNENFVKCLHSLIENYYTNDFFWNGIKSNSLLLLKSDCDPFFNSSPTFINDYQPFGATKSSSTSSYQNDWTIFFDFDYSNSSMGKGN
ncbi:heat shock factor protein 5-like [Sarcoptes scabiei]|nr:heat shock factor protein 5-like [Sarcoptes scabiei]